MTGLGWVGRRAVLGLPVLGGAAWGCTQVASVPLVLEDGFPLVPAVLAGRAVRFLLDTGAQGMLVTPETALALSLPLAGMTRVMGTGGSQEARVVRLPGLRLGGAGMPELLAPVLPLPVSLRGEAALAGLLGASLLARFDLDIDVPGGRLALWAPGTCPRPAGVVLPMEVSRAGEPFIPVRVNGQTLLALLDTGSRATLLTRAAARLLGVGAPVSANTAVGVDGTRTPLEHVRVRLGLGDEAAVETAVSVTSLQLERGDMLLGLDAVVRRRVWVAYGRGEAVFSG